MYQRALDGFTRTPPSDVKSQLDLFYNMGLLSRDMHNFERAKLFFNQAHEGFQKILGSQHALTVKALYRLNKEIERSTQGDATSDGQGGSVETG